MSSPFTSSDPERPELLQAASPTQRADHLIEIYPWLAPETLEAAAVHIVNENASFKSRWRRLVALADKFNTAIGDLAACRNGCCYCCSMPTLIYRHEAVILSRASGRTCVELSYRAHHQVLAEIETLPIRPCPFLAGGRCSVYEKRPMICRLHNSLNDNPRDCDLSVPQGLRGEVMAFNPDLIEMAYHALVRSHSPRASWGTIHQFFPN